MNKKATLNTDSQSYPPRWKIYKYPFILSLVMIFLLLIWWFVGNLTQDNAHSDNGVVPAIRASESFPAGDATVSLLPFPSFMLPAKNLPKAKRKYFHAGKALAHQPWIKAPTVTDARDGLGPIYNARTCLFCHINGGRGKMPDDDKTLLMSAFLRLSLAGVDKIHGVIAEPTYGVQLQTQSVALSHQLRSQVKNSDLKHKEVAPEAYVYINWQQKTVTYPDGKTVNLRIPKPILKNLGYGKMHPDTLMGIRNAPPLQGVGLLELIAQSDLDKKADPDDENADGISGRVNQVWDFDLKKTVAGRFGLKANKANVRLQTAGAYAGDMGISNPVFPKQSCTKSQTLCLKTPNGNNAKTGVEISEELLTLTVNFTKNLGVPIRRKPNNKKVLQGRSIFYQTGCQQCHTPRYITQGSKEFPHLGKQTIWPYSDLLLHDMGDALGDGRSDYLATGNEWRTPPLWGVGLGEKVNTSHNLLHDGRARSVEEAVLWHGGEAEATKQRFMTLKVNDRQVLLKFVESL
ncbi:MAG: thiol oxidoreductase [Cocleimonas sp.]|nr:thiol oxidoreductase [Cocleimonas sp.]